ncbi:MAG: hypothetical protein KY444_02460 [Gemmatimonadetes bacterium]|nr:hypothetical protein [Gemmatimonadota bacterium]
MRAPKAALLICLLAAACAPAPGATAGAPATSRTDAPRRERDPLRITMAEIREAAPSDALQLVQRLRPQWLRDQVSGDPGSMADDVVVYLDNTRMGGRAQLRQIQSRTIGRMEFVEGRIAARRWGVSHALGAILVFTPTQADFAQQR